MTARVIPQLSLAPLAPCRSGLSRDSAQHLIMLAFAAFPSTMACVPCCEGGAGTARRAI